MRTGARGFTLIEVMVALVIMAVIAAMGWQGVAGMAKAREVSREAVDRTLRQEAALAQFEADLRQIYESLRAPGIGFDGKSLRIVRRQGAGVQVVVWALQGDQWLRWSGPVVQTASALQDSWLESLGLQGGEPGQVAVLGGVVGFNVFYSRNGLWTNAQSSGNIVSDLPTPGEPAPARPQIELPQGVRLQLDLPAGRLQRDLFVIPQLVQ